MSRYAVHAFNTATASTNKIHDDEVARRLGFRGGLVPGVDVYAYMCHLPAERWGRAWLERGTIEARFDAPVYDGDEVEIDAVLDTYADETTGEALLLSLRDPTGASCARARATLPTTPAAPPVDGDRWPASDPPASPPPAGPSTLVDPLGHVVAGFSSDRAPDYLDDVREWLPLFRDAGPAHPGWLLRFANTVFASNVRLGPWIHVSSTVQFFGTVNDGDRVDTRALVTDVRDRGGHGFVELDVLQLVERTAVTRTRHTAIYRPRGT